MKHDRSIIKLFEDVKKDACSAGEMVRLVNHEDVEFAHPGCRHSISETWTVQTPIGPFIEKLLDELPVVVSIDVGAKTPIYSSAPSWPVPSVGPDSDIGSNAYHGI